jgi:hypothetical protein
MNLRLITKLTCLTLSCLLYSCSPISKVRDELSTCKSQEDVRVVFDRCKKDFTTFNGDIDEYFLQVIRDKLDGFNLNDKEIAECILWLPTPTSLNLIIVPDLSKRIVDEINNPDQISNDTVILNYIWTEFENHTKFKIDSRDRLIVDVTDKDQAIGQFRTLANNLIFDLSEHKGKINRLYFDDTTVRARYSKNIKQLYELAKSHPSGADYWNYFRHDLSKHIQKSTLFNNYRNVLIIITDGYLETEKVLYTGDWTTRNFLAEKIKKKYSEEEILNRIKIPDIAQKFPMLEVLMLEVYKRTKYSPQEPKDKGTSEDYNILSVLWSDWFKRLEIKNVNEKFFIYRNNATQLTKDEIDKFINRK